jgi:CRP-like cAMP-binding protein
MTARDLPLRLVKGGPEQQAIEAGEIDAIIDHEGSNVILLPAARRALNAAAKRGTAAKRDTADEITIANSLLAALPRAEYQRLLGNLEPLTLKSGEVLHEQGAPIRHVYFPVDCVVSLLATVQEGQGLEIGLVGYEGMVGIAVALGQDIATGRAVVQVAGTAMRMKAPHFRQEFQECPLLRRELLPYAHLKLALARQTIACNCFHAVEARLARWLLMTSDRVRSENFFLTQDSLAASLGVRRTTINVAAGPLKRRKLVSYSRGRIRILDRKGLEAASCRCYARI